jgi:iron complex transport system ATP-binding protein
VNLRLEQVQFCYGDRKVIDDLSMELAPGRFYGILGPNGSGKTTLLDLLAGHRKPSAGRICYRDRQLGDYPRKQLAREMALVPQNFYVNFPFRVREVVMMGRYPHIPRFRPPSAEDERIVADAMSATRIDAYAGRFVTELSGGEKQRVVFARALAQNTPLLLLDEATSSMDIHHSIAALSLVARRVKSNNRTAVGVMQDINLAGMYCEHLIFLKHGRIVSQGPTQQVLQPDTIRRVFEVETKVFDEPFSGARQVVFKK